MPTKNQSITETLAHSSQVVILELALLIADRPPVVINLDSPEAIASLEKTPFTIKEGAEYSMRVKFRVQHEVISGLRYLQLVKRRKITVDKSDQMMVAPPLPCPSRSTRLHPHRAATVPTPPRTPSTRRPVGGPIIAC